MKLHIKKYFVGLFLLLASTTLLAQKDTTGQDVGKIPYSKEFSFDEGVYLSFSDFKHNEPIPKNRIITNVSGNDPDFFKKVLKGKYFFVLDNLGTAQRLKTQAIWGYVEKGNVYINFNDMFNRISYFSSISHFLSQKKVYNNYGGTFYNDYTLTNRMQPNITRETEEYLLSMFSGKVYVYNTKSVLTVLARDSTLHNEYKQLSQKKQKQLKFFYLRKFNKRNTFYIYK